jgi:hypothetical protein
LYNNLDRKDRFQLGEIRQLGIHHSIAEY